MLLLATACASPSHEGMHAPPEFMPYLVSFHQEALKRGIILNFKSVDVQFEEMDDAYAGYCQEGPRLIVRIEPDFWRAMPEEWREQLLYHELGHCILQQGHRDGSIMAAWGFFSVDYYRLNRDMIVDELFWPERF